MQANTPSRGTCLRRAVHLGARASSRLARGGEAVNLRSCVLALLLTLPLLLGCDRGAALNRKHTLTGPALQQAYPWVSETSKHWSQDVDLASGKVRGYSELGCFALGNGRIFTTEGLRYPFGAMSNIFGPTYQKNQGSLGRQEVALLVGGKPQALPSQRMAYVMRSGVVHTQLTGPEGVRLDLYDCIPPPGAGGTGGPPVSGGGPGGYAICRVILVTNDSKRSLRNVSVAVSHAGAVGGTEGGRLVSDGPPRWVRIGFAGVRTKTADTLYAMPLPAAAQAVNKSVADTGGSSVICPLGTLKHGQSAATLAYMVIAPSAEKADAEEKRLGEVGCGVLQETRDWWQKWYADALTVETPDERINEFIPIQQYLCRIQQAESGGYSPMYMYTTCWVRDSNGPVRFMTQSGKFEEVKRYLDYYYACCAQSRRIPMNFPLDLAVLPSPERREAGGEAAVHWSKAPTERAEVASFLILQHYWYWQQSGDLTPIKEHWGYLRRNLLGQRVDHQGRLPFHGDETYRFPGYQIFESTQKEPTDWVSMDLLSADSAWEYIAAAGALREWAEILGKPDEAAEYAGLALKVRDALDRDFWMEDRGYYAPAISDFSGEQYRYPFANIMLRPLWLQSGLGAPPWGADHLPRTTQSALKGLQYLWRDPAAVSTTPGCGYYVSMLPGMTLDALGGLRRTETPRAIEGLLAAASPAGEFSEMNKPDGKPSDQYWGKNRIRPWEGGINGEALVSALTGFVADARLGLVSVNPRLPAAWDHLYVRNLRFRGSRLGLALDKTAQGRVLKLTLQGSQSLKVQPAGYLPPGDNLLFRTIRPGQALRFTQTDPHYTDFASQPPRLGPKAFPFSYGEPAFAGRARTIVVTWSRDTFAAHKGRPSPAAIDTKIAFPPEYLAAALYDHSGKRRADTLILDVSKYPGHCKTGEFWTSGEGKKITDHFTSLGGKVEQHPDPQDKPGDLFGE